MITQTCFRALQALPSLALIVVLAACSANSGAPSSNTGTSGTDGGTSTGTETATPPAVNMKLSSVAIQPGESATITWDSDAATTCTASGAWAGAQLLDNNEGIQTGPLAGGTYSFGLTCVGPGGSSSKVAPLVVGDPAAPVVDLQVTPSAVQPGDSVLIEWSAANATTCTGVGGTGSDGWTVTQATSNLAGLHVGPLSATGQVSYELDCTGPGGSGSSSQIVTVATTAPPAPPSVTFAASPSSITPGQSITLTWNVANATACTATGGSGSDSWSGTQPTSSTGTVVGPIAVAGTYTYALTCTGTGGSSTQNITIFVGTSTTPLIPTVQVAVSPTSIPSGSSANLTWTTTNSSFCVASGSWVGTRPTSGSAVSTGTLTTRGVYSYTLTCSGPGGNATQTALLTVTAPEATVTNLTLVPNTIVAGQSTSINWNSVNATSCTASGGTGSDNWNGVQPTSSSGMSIGPISAAGTYTYTLTCAGPGGPSDPISATLVVSPLPPAATITTFTATPNTINAGDTTTIAWQTSNASSCTATGGFTGDGWAGTKLTSSTGMSIGPFSTSGNYTYTLNCSGSGGSNGAVSITITVNGTTTPAPTATISTFIANPLSISVGQSITLIWSTTDATACTPSGGSGTDSWSTSTIATSSTGTAIGPILVAGTFTYTLTCTGTGGSSGPHSGTVTVNAVTPAATITTFTATPNNVQTGQSIVLSWTTNNATSCTAGGGSGTDGWAGSTQLPSNSGLTIGPLTVAGTFNYLLLCQGSGGASGQASITVTVGQSTAPASITSFSASPNSVQVGGLTTLAWTASNATGCTASGGTGTDTWTGTVNTASSGQSVGPIASTGTVTYTLTCTGPGGSSGPTSVSVTVGASTPPATIGSLNASPNTIQAGQSTTLTWGTTNATGCTASGGAGADGWNGAVPISSTGTTVGPIVTAGTYTYTLTCTGTGGTSGPSSVTVTVTPPPAGAPVVTITANNSATGQIQPGSSFTLKWSVTNAITCTASGGTGSDNWSGTQQVSSTGTTIGPITIPGIYTYNLSCVGSAGSGGGSVTVTVISSSAADCGIETPSTALLTPAATVSSATSGGLCVLGCAVTGSSNVINANLADFAAMTLALGVATTDTLTVTGSTTYPAGRRAGFLLANPSGLLSLNLLSNVTIQTLKSNVVQESATTSNLLGVSVAGLLSNPNEGFAGFTTTKSFDSVQVVVNPLASLLTETDVYGACVSLQ